MTARFGRAKYATMRRDFNALRDAIRAYDPVATELAWDKCERWLEAATNPIEPIITPRDNAKPAPE